MVALFAFPVLAGTWTTGIVDEHLLTGQTGIYTTSMLPGGTTTTVEIRYGLWNSPDVEFELWWQGSYVGSVLCDAGYSVPGPTYQVFDVTPYVVGGTNTIEVRAVTPPGGPAGGEAVMGALTADFVDSVVDADLDGFTGVDGDCNDGDPTIFPGADETCDGVDQDCDGLVDNDAIDGSAWYRDHDLDGWGGGDSLVACDAPDGAVADGGDCDDEEPFVYPGADEYCNAVDEDCDGEVDNDPVDAELFWGDSDGDGFGDELTELWACERPLDASMNPDDCDDSDGTVHPDAAEACDGVDQDCDGDVDEGLTCDDNGDPVDPDAAADPDKSSVTTCGCASGPPAAGWLGLLLLPLVGRRR